MPHPARHPRAAGVLVTLLALSGCARAATETFESFATGAFTTRTTAVGTLTAPSGQAEISNSGVAVPTRKLRLTGGTTGSTVTLTPGSAYAVPQSVTFNAERWTSASPFTFTVEAVNGSGAATTIHTGTSTVAVGKNTFVSCLAPAGTASLRFKCTSPANTGILVDNLAIDPAESYSLTSSDTYQPVAPVLRRKSDNPVVALNIRVNAPLDDAPAATSVTVDLDGTTSLADLAAVRLVYTGAVRDYVDDSTTTTAFGAALTPAESLTFTGNQKLRNGDNWFWVMAEPAANADIDHRVDAGFDSVRLGDGTTVTPATSSPEGSQRLGIALRKRGDDSSAAYRIPGICTTNAGTLIAVYDIRYAGGGDLPANIDVGMSRSVDGGRTWTAMKVIMDMGTGTSNGVGDPTVFTDKVSGRIWASALWASNGKAYNGSGPGISPSVTGQLVMTYSDDDGLTWATPYSITPQVKDPAWKLLFNGPGSGITKSDGTLVMPVQYRLGDSAGTVYSSIIYSADRGATWSIALGAMPRTNEAQVAEGTDGSLILNCRSEAGGGLRRVATTKNFGARWTVALPKPGATPAADTSLLADPTCQGSLFRLDHPTYGPTFFFSNPAVPSGSRREMTVKVSLNNCRSWPENLRTLYDYRSLNGYSCLTNADADHLGILYEGRTEIWFVRVPFAELLDISRP